MPSFFQEIQSAKRGRSLDKLREQIAELEAEQKAFGSPKIEQDKPGAFDRIVDFLSRPNYAVAGFTEALMNERSIRGGAARALSEIFSGVGGIQGRKRAFGQVLEGQGYGTTTLADVFPALEGTWVGHFGSRGAAGIAMDIAFDPLTYMSFGASAGVKVATSKGLRYLNQKGLKAYQDIFQAKSAVARETLEAAGKADPVGVGNALTRVMNETEEAFEKLYTVGDDIAQEFLEPGGAKIFGKQIPGTQNIPGLGTAMTRVIGMLPDSVSQPVIKTAQDWRKSALTNLNGIFSAEGVLANLPQPFRKRAVALTNQMFRGSFAHRTHLMSQMDGLERQYRRWEKADPGIGQRWHEVREGDLPISAIKNPEELAAFRATMGLYDSMRGTALAHGVLDADQIRPNYIFHAYKNVEDLAMVHPRPGVTIPSEPKARFTKERKFDTTKIAVEETKRLHSLSLHSLSRGEADKIWPELIPDYDVFKNMRTYIGAHADAVARKAWHEEMLEQFGKTMQDFDELYEPGTLEAIEKAAAKSSPKFTPGMQKELDRLAEIEARGPRSVKPGDLHPVKRKQDPWLTAKQATRLRDLRVLRKQAIADSIPKKGAPEWFTPENIPLVRGSMTQLEEAAAKIFGPDGAQYQPLKGVITDNELLYLPKAIIDTLESVNSQLFNTKDYKAFGKLLKGFDWMNNNFKWGVYTIFPASAVRDGYSNIALAMLRVGAAALDPKRHRDAIRLMAGRELGKQFADTPYTVGQLRELSRTLGVWVPGSVFVEQTGTRLGVTSKVGRVRHQLVEKRAAIENEARILLWMEEIRRGVDPRSAADTVGEFLFNYGEVSRVERDLFRRLIPFYTFTRKNVELQWKTLRSNPGMAINQVKPFRHRNDEKEMMVKWEAEAMGIRLDRDGKTVHALQGIDLPLRNLDTIWAGSFSATGKRLAGMVTPLIKAGPESLLGRSFFTGSDMARTRSDTVGRAIEVMRTPKPIKDWLAYKKEYDEVGRPSYSFDGVRFNLLFRSWMFSRIVSTSDRQFREYAADANWAAAMTDVLTGIRRKDINLDEQMARKLSRRFKQLQSSGVRRGLRVPFTRTFTPEENARAEFQ